MIDVQIRKRTLSEIITIQIERISLLEDRIKDLETDKDVDNLAIWETINKIQQRGVNMKYYFVMEKNERHIVVAENEESLKRILEGPKMKVDSYYELVADSFKDEGFLMSN